MEHFLPLAIASMVISLISIILLDHFGPSTSTKTENTTLSDTENSVEEQGLIADNVDAETNMEITAGQSKPIKTAESIDNKSKNPSVNSFFGLTNDVIMNITYLQLGR